VQIPGVLLSSSWITHAVKLELVSFFGTRRAGVQFLPCCSHELLGS
jgi:hypothetical protein